MSLPYSTNCSRMIDGNYTELQENGDSDAAVADVEILVEMETGINGGDEISDEEPPERIKDTDDLLGNNPSSTSIGDYWRTVQHGGEHPRRVHKSSMMSSNIESDYSATDTDIGVDLSPAPPRKYSLHIQHLQKKQAKVEMAWDKKARRNISFGVLTREESHFCSKLYHTKRRILKLKDYHDEARAMRDIEKFLAQPVVLFKVHHTLWEDIVEEMIAKLCSEKPELNLNVNTTMESLISTEADFVLPECIQGMAQAVVAAGGLGFVMSILFFMEGNISESIVSNPSNKLKKGSAFHMDMFVTGVINAILSIFCLPWVHGSLPHSPLHVRALADIEEHVENGHLTENIVYSIRVLYLRVVRASGFFPHQLGFQGSPLHRRPLNNHSSHHKPIPDQYTDAYNVNSTRYEQIIV
eukprot:sb/3465200/